MWAFEPPGGLAGPSIAKATRDFCTSVVLGKDWIPRLTLRTFERLRDEMVCLPALATAWYTLATSMTAVGLVRGSSLGSRSRCQGHARLLHQRCARQRLEPPPHAAHFQAPAQRDGAAACCFDAERTSAQSCLVTVLCRLTTVRVRWLT